MRRRFLLLVAFACVIFVGGLFISYTESDEEVTTEVDPPTLRQEGGEVKYKANKSPHRNENESVSVSDALSDGVEDALRGSGIHFIRCHVDIDDIFEAGFGDVYDNDEGRVLLSAQHVGNSLYIYNSDSTILAEGSGLLRLENYQPVAIEWSGHECVPELIRVTHGSAMIQGVVTNSAGNPEPGVLVKGCDASGFTDNEGYYWLTSESHTTECQLTAARFDGGLISRSPAKNVVLIEDEVVTIDFIVSEYPNGGIGINLTRTSDGYLVKSFIEGGPAEGSALLIGDLVVKVDGIDVQRIDEFELKERLMGDAGSHVSVTISSNGREETIRLRREILTYKQLLGH